jgi:SAM-dependent methyltransferase
LDAGFQRLTVLDISKAALQRSRARLGERADLIQWVASDVTEAELEGQFDVWHDRAVFHFLTSPDDRQRYQTRLRNALAPGGRAIIATFGPQGPTHCSGLPVQRYDAEGLHQELGHGFHLQNCEVTTHVTPSGKTQQFVYASFRRI